MDFSSWDRTLSSTDFGVAANAFVEQWKTINPHLPPWSWVSCPISPGFVSHQVDGYLSLEKICLLKSSEVDCIANEESTCFEENDSDDCAILVRYDSPRAHSYDLHILYSSSYRVPVLYFRAQSSDGQPLALEDIEKDLPSHSANVLLKSKWTFITQEEHPYLRRPWYKLHPCGTSEWMKLLFLAEGDTPLGKSRSPFELYLMSWFSVVGQVVGLKISSEILLNKLQSGQV